MTAASSWKSGTSSRAKEHYTGLQNLQFKSGQAYPLLAIRPRVQGITSVPRVVLTGTIPSEISALTELRVLKLEQNELTGRIPPELGSLSQMEVLVLSASWRSGKFLDGTISASAWQI